MLRKTDCVTARITDIETYRLQLLHVLHKRFDSTVTVISNADNFSSVDKVMTNTGLSKKEKDSMSLFISRFRIATYEEPPLLDFPSCFFGMTSSEKPKFSLISRWGHMYITHKEIFFNADAATISNVMGLFSKSSTATTDALQLVLPIKTIAKCNYGAKITDSIANALGKKKDTAMELQDSAGNVYTFGMPTGSPPQYASRICDLLTILQSCVMSGHDLNNITPMAADEDMVTGKSNPEADVPIVNSIIKEMPAPEIGDASTKSQNASSCSSNRKETILSSRKEAFSHVMKLASSALDTALPSKFKSPEKQEGSSTGGKNKESGSHSDAESEAGRKNVTPIKMESASRSGSGGWFEAAPIGTSMSVPSGSSIVAGSSRPADTHEERSTADTGIATASTSINVSSSGRPRPKTASLGKNIQVSCNKWYMIYAIHVQ